MDSMTSVERINSLLLRGDHTIENDVMHFREWERGEISTAKCLKLFRQNNRQDDRIDISKADFEHWLNSLGYIRGGI